MPWCHQHVYLSTEAKGLEEGEEVDGVPLWCGHLGREFHYDKLPKGKRSHLIQQAKSSYLELIETVAAALGREGRSRARKEVGGEELAANGLGQPAWVQDYQVAQLSL